MSYARCVVHHLIHPSCTSIGQISALFLQESIQFACFLLHIVHHHETERIARKRTSTVRLVRFHYPMFARFHRRMSKQWWYCPSISKPCGMEFRCFLGIATLMRPNPDSIPPGYPPKSASFARRRTLIRSRNKLLTFQLRREKRQTDHMYVYWSFE